MFKKKIINNQFYDELGEKWMDCCDHPIALLRAENAARTPWIIDKIHQFYPDSHANILDVACGAGFLANELAKKKFSVTGIDLSEKSLKVAKAYDSTKTVSYIKADAYHLPFRDKQFDIVCSMDFLEHVEKPGEIVKEVSRVLKPGGLFFFHTFNRNFLSWLIVLKGIEWFVKNSPKDLHVYNLFIKPVEFEKLCVNEQISIMEIIGLNPKILSKAFWQLIFTRSVPSDFTFRISSQTWTSYCGYGKKMLE